MDAGASFVLGPRRPPLHGRAGLLRFRTTAVRAAWARGPPRLWDHRSPRRMGLGASSALGPPRPPPHGCGDLLRLGTTEAPAAWAPGPPPLWDH